MARKGRSAGGYPTLLGLVRRRGRLAVASGATLAALACGNTSVAGGLTFPDIEEPDVAADPSPESPEVEAPSIDLAGILDGFDPDEAPDVTETTPEAGEGK